MIPGYAELHCLSHYTFLRGASFPEELVERAAELGYTALAVTDECSVAGVVRAHVAAKKTKLKLIVGSEITLADGMKLVLLVKDIRGYEALCELITKARRAAPKGKYRLVREDFAESVEGLVAMWIPRLDPGPLPATAGARDDEARAGARDDEARAGARDDEGRPGDEGRWLASRFPGNAFIAVELHRGPDDNARIARLEALGRELGLPCVAAGDVHMH